MKIKITRHGLQLIPVNQPIDDIFIEEILGLYNEGDRVDLVRVSANDTFNSAFTTLDAVPPPLYILETKDPSQTEKVKTALPTVPNLPISEELVALPCPFCGTEPELIMHETEGPNNSRGAHGKIVCINSQCPAQPQVCDDRRVVGVESVKKCEATIISLWNKRAKC